MKCISQAYFALALVSISSLSLLYSSDSGKSLTIRQLAQQRRKPRVGVRGGSSTSDGDQKQYTAQMGRQKPHVSPEGDAKELAQIQSRLQTLQLDTGFQVASESYTSSRFGSSSSSSSNSSDVSSPYYRVTKPLLEELEKCAAASDEMIKRMTGQITTFTVEEGYARSFSETPLSRIHKRIHDIATQWSKMASVSGMLDSGGSVILGNIFSELQRDCGPNAAYSACVPSRHKKGSYDWVLKRKSERPTGKYSGPLIISGRVAEVRHSDADNPTRIWMHENHIYTTEEGTTPIGVVLEGTLQNLQPSDPHYYAPDAWIIIFPRSTKIRAIALFMAKGGKFMKGTALFPNNKYLKMAQTDTAAIIDMILCRAFTASFENHYIK